MAKNIEEFHEVLNLSEEQRSDFESITKKYAKQMKAVKEDSGENSKSTERLNRFKKTKMQKWKNYF